MTGQNDRSDESLTGQAHDQAGHCPLTGRYFEPWIVEIPLPRISRSKLCPTAAITNAFRFTAAASAFNSQVFNWVDQKQLVKIFTCVHPANSSYVSWFRPQAVCWELFSQGWGVLCIPSRRTHQID